MVIPLTKTWEKVPTDLVKFSTQGRHTVDIEVTAVLDGHQVAPIGAEEEVGHTIGRGAHIKELLVGAQTD